MQGKRQRLVNHLRAAISCGNFRRGDKLPSIRDFAERFDTSFTTARSAVLELQAAGLLELRHGNGVFVCGGAPESAAPAQHRIGVFVADAGSINPDASYAAHALRGLQEEAAATNCRINLHFKPFYLATEPVSVTAEEVADCDVLAFLGSYDRIGVRCPDGIPAVGLSMYLPDRSDFSGIGIDPFSAAEQAAAFFHRRGIGKVRLIASSIGFGRLLAGNFEAAFAPFGEAETIRHDDNHPPLALFADPDCGCLFASGTVFQYTAQSYAREFGRPLAADRTVLAIDGKSRYVPSYLPVSNLGIDWVEAGRTTLAECLYRIGHPGGRGRRIYLPPDLQEAVDS